MTKWDTIQEDIKDQYTYLDEEIEIAKQEGQDDDDIFGFEKAISIDHLTDEELNQVASIFGIEAE